MDSALMLLADGRFPSGRPRLLGGSRSRRWRSGDVVDVATLERYLHGRLATTGRVDAAFAAYTCARSADLATIAGELDDEYSARVMSPYLRATSRRLGRQLLRAAGRVWPSVGVAAVSATPGGPHQPIALGAVVAAAGGSPADAAAVAFHHLGAAVTSAAVRLLGLDPIELAAVQAGAGRAVDARRDEWIAWSSGSPSRPARGRRLAHRDPRRATRRPRRPAVHRMTDHFTGRITGPLTVLFTEHWSPRAPA